MNNENIKLQFVAHLKSSKIAWDMDMENFLSGIKTGVYINGKTTIDIRSKIEKMRSLDRSINSESLEYDITKKKLPGVLVHGLFDGQRGEDFFTETYTGIVGIDIDFKKKVNIKEVKDKTIEYLGKNSFAITYSPGGNGLHVYLSAKVESKDQIVEVQEDVKIKTGLPVDKVVKDVSRLFCCTMDPEAWTNENPEPYEYTSLQPGAEKQGSDFSDIEALLIEKSFFGKVKYGGTNIIYKAFLLLAKHFDKEYIESYLGKEKNRIRLFDPGSGNINSIKKNQDSLDHAYDAVKKWAGEFDNCFRTGSGIFEEVINYLGEKKIQGINTQLFFSEYSKESIFKIQKYDGFENYPNNYPGIPEVYREDVPGQIYNMYHPLINQPAEGSWENIKIIFEHLFTDQVQYLYDYARLLLINPTQLLPILVLISTERETGKTTFLNLMRKIFIPMASIISMADYSSQFNAHFVNKLVVAIDESHLDKRELEKIKAQSTAEEIRCEYKGKDTFYIRNVQHFILASNSLEFTYIDRQENRFWTFEVTKPKTAEPGLYKKAINEIPAFIHYLIYEHKMIVPEEVTRFYFPTEIITEYFKGDFYQKVKKAFLHQFKDRCRTWFAMHEGDKKEIRFSLQDFHAFYKIPFSTPALCEMLFNEDWIGRYDRNEGSETKKRLQYNLSFLKGDPDQPPDYTAGIEDQYTVNSDRRENLFYVRYENVIDYEIDENKNELPY